MEDEKGADYYYKKRKGNKKNKVQIRVNMVIQSSLYL